MGDSEIDCGRWRAEKFDHRGVGGDDRQPPVQNRIPVSQVSLAEWPAARYGGKGEATLVDNEMGSADFHDGKWLGFQGRNLVATFDLTSVRAVERIGASFLRSQGSWIFLPQEVRVEGSVDGNEYQELCSQRLTCEPDARPGFETVDFQITEALRFVRVHAVTIGECPKWHAAAGGKAWLFCDEIWVD